MHDACRAPRRTFVLRPVALFALALLASLSACASSSSGSDPITSLSAKAESAREGGRAGPAARLYEQAALAALEADETPTQIALLFDAAECWLLDGKPPLAALNGEKASRLIERLPPASTNERVARMRHACLQGDLAFEDRPAEARRHYDAALKKARGRERDAVLFRQSLLAERLGDAAGAKRLAWSAGDPKSPLYHELRRMLDVQAPTVAKSGPAAPVVAKTPPPAAPTAAAKSPPILPRTAWGARRTRSNFDRMTPISRLTVHHTATRLQGNSARVAADAIKSYQREHQEKEGWADIGYHFLIDPSGRIWEGRPISYQGAHAGSPQLNVGNIGIALIGDFTVQQPSAAQKRALTDLLDSLCAKYRVAHGRVYTHKELLGGGTECPGPALQRIVEQWRREVVKS
ncbi:MAG: N-acetylmuramoyl-L-alanine amidase [Planctomycetes bacterium]|nr:N-acetylmuramoyl-L-alanine amidase [Planctomycetota bacterium]